MSLETWANDHELYLARGDEVPPHRPLFTGDVLGDVDVAGFGSCIAVVIAHPCTMRKGAKLNDRVLAAVVESEQHPQQAERWTDGFYRKSPLPDLRRDGGFASVLLDNVGTITTAGVTDRRIACLLPRGVGILQQRMIHNLTRLEVPTSTLWTVFGHEYEECDLAQEWIEELDGIEPSPLGSFENWITEGQPSRQSLLGDPQHVPLIRREMRAEISRRSIPR